MPSLCRLGLKQHEIQERFPAIAAELREPLDRGACRLDGRLRIQAQKRLRWIVIRRMTLVLQIGDGPSDRLDMVAETAVRDEAGETLRRRGLGNLVADLLEPSMRDGSIG